MSDISRPFAEPLVLRERDSRGVVTLVLNRPASFNALSAAMLDALQHELDDVAVDETSRVVVIAATGKAFCAGHDLKEMRAEPSQDFYEKLFAQCSRMMLSIQTLPVPVIAKVQGIATAAGCQLVAACDLAVAQSDARFAVSGINFGLFCSTPSVPLSRNVLRKHAFEMLVTGDFITAEEGEGEGSRQSGRGRPAEIDSAVESLVASIVAKPRVAIAMGKQLFYRQLEGGIAAAYADAGHTMADNMMHPAALEGSASLHRQTQARLGQLISRHLAPRAGRVEGRSGRLRTIPVPTTPGYR